MKLPRRGCLVNPDGTISWAWEHNDPNREFDAVAPIDWTEDGRIKKVHAHPDSFVLDMEGSDVPAEDIFLLYHERDSARVRRQDNGSFKITKILRETMPDGTVEEEEIEHPLTAIRRARKEKRQRFFMRKGFLDEHEYEDIILTLPTPQTQSEVNEFARWQYEDCTKAGLLALKASREEARTGKGPKV